MDYASLNDHDLPPIPVQLSTSCISTAPLVGYLMNADMIVRIYFIPQG
jgi:hypothetical protein